MSDSDDHVPTTPEEGVADLFEREAAAARTLFASARQNLPSARELAETAIAKALGSKVSDEEFIKDNFSELVSVIQVQAYHAYLEAERLACGTVLASMIKQQIEDGVSDSLEDAVSARFFTFDRFFLSLTQSRRTRAGSTFEAVVSTLFKALSYPHTAQPQIAGSTPDYVLPSIEHYAAFATDCMIFTCKRTLRERWRQVVTEGMTGQAFFLATIDEGLSPTELARMKDRNVIVVVPRVLKVSAYPTALNVISFESFFDHHLDPAIVRWKASGALK